MYRQLGDFSLGQGSVGGSASWGRCQLEEVPVGEVLVGGSASWGTKFNLGRTIFSNFAGGKKLNLSTKNVFCENIIYSIYRL